MSQYQRIFNLVKGVDKDEKHTISVKCQSYSQIKYVLTGMIFIAVLVNLHHYMTRGVNIQCYSTIGRCHHEHCYMEEKTTAYGPMNKNDPNCTKDALDAVGTALCIDDIINDLRVDLYERFPYFLIICVIVMFGIAQFEVAMYKQRENRFLDIINTHFDPYQKGALDEFKRILRNGVLVSQYKAREYLMSIGGGATVFTSDYIRYLVGCVFAALGVILSIGLGVYYQYRYHYNRCEKCNYNTSTVCRLILLRSYSHASFIVGALLIAYIGIATRHWRKLSHCQRLIEGIKKLGTSKFRVSSALRNHGFKDSIRPRTHRNIDDLPTAEIQKHYRMVTEAGATGNMEIGHIIKKIYVANDENVTIYCLAKFYKDFEENWRAVNVEVTEKPSVKKPGKRVIQVKWDNAPVFGGDHSFNCPRYVVYLYDPTKLVDRREENPMSNLNPFSIDFDGLLPGNEYTIAICTKLASYLISSHVEKFTLVPPKPTLRVTEVSDTYAEIEWKQLPQAIYYITGYSVDVTPGSLKETVRAEFQTAEFDPVNYNSYKHRIEHLEPGQDYTIKLTAMTKGSKTDTECSIMTNDS